MSESSIQLPPNSTGPNLRVRQNTISSATVYAEVVHMGDPSTTANLQAVNSSGQASVQQGWNAGRTYLVFLLDRVTGITTEALAAMTVNKGGALTTTASSYTVTTGKTLRLQALTGNVVESGTVTSSGRIRVRSAGSSISSSSGVILNLDFGQSASAAVAGAGNSPGAVSVPDGLEIPSGNQVAFSQVVGSTTATVTATLVGYEY